MMRDERPLYTILQELEESNWTTRALGMLDYVVPGEWENVRSFDRMIELVTGSNDQEGIQMVGEKAMQIYADPNNGYQRAVWVFQTVDSIDKLGGAATMARKIGDSVGFLSFLSKVTPAADTTQGIDAALKFAAELTTFCLINGIPGDSVGDFAGSLVNAAKEDIIRVSAFLAFDLIIPLGPDFMSKTLGFIKDVSEGELSNNSLFKAIREYMPGSSVAEQKELIVANMDANANFLQNYANDKGMDQQGLLDRLRQYVDIADDKLDYVAATLDVMTNYYEHTGIQTVTRRVVERAYQEL